MNDEKENTMLSPGGMPLTQHQMLQPPSFASASVESTLRAVLCRIDARTASVDIVRAALASAGVLASREWVHGWLLEVNNHERS